MELLHDTAEGGSDAGDPGRLAVGSFFARHESAPSVNQESLRAGHFESSVAPIFLSNGEPDARRATRVSRARDFKQRNCHAICGTNRQRLRPMPLPGVPPQLRASADFASGRRLLKSDLCSAGALDERRHAQ